MAGKKNGAHRWMPWQERLWLKVRKTDGCWLWTGRVQSEGYGQMIADKRRRLCHHLSWEIHNGKPVPPGMKVLHSCDVPRCCNPAHLSLGTQRDNMRDMSAKGRSAKGKRRIKLTAEIATAIRKRHAEGVAMPVIAKEFKVGRGTVFLIVHRKTWKHVP